MKMMLLDIDTDPETLQEIVPFTFIIQSISKDLFTQEKNFNNSEKEDKKFDLHFKG